VVYRKIFEYLDDRREKKGGKVNPVEKRSNAGGVRGGKASRTGRIQHKRRGKYKKFWLTRGKEKKKSPKPTPPGKQSKLGKYAGEGGTTGFRKGLFC